MGKMISLLAGFILLIAGAFLFTGGFGLFTSTLTSWSFCRFYGGYLIFLFGIIIIVTHFKGWLERIIGTNLLTKNL